MAPKTGPQAKVHIGANCQGCGGKERWTGNCGDTLRPSSSGLRWKRLKAARRLASYPVNTKDPSQRDSVLEPANGGRPILSLKQPFETVPKSGPSHTRRIALYASIAADRPMPIRTERICLDVPHFSRFVVWRLGLTILSLVSQILLCDDKIVKFELYSRIPLLRLTELSNVNRIQCQQLSVL